MESDNPNYKKIHRPRNLLCGKTRVQTSTGTWQITYNGANRPVCFRNEETDTTVECGYDSQGRRYFKKVTVAGTTTLHHRYIYRGYLQIAALDLTRSAHPALWLVTWDPSQPTATRPLAIQKDGTWFTYGYDLTKNICEVFGPAGYIRTTYSYAPFGSVTASGDVTQPFQWSSEHYDSELDLVYYNYRHYSPSLGRFLSRDPIEEQGGLNLYALVKNAPIFKLDKLGRSMIAPGAGVWYPDRTLPSPYTCCGGKLYKKEIGCCIGQKWREKTNSSNLDVKIGFRRLDSFWPISHVFINVRGKKFGWAGDVYDETPFSGENQISYELPSRSDLGLLPNGIPCKCATTAEIESCLLDESIYPRGSYNVFIRNCGDWADKLLGRCCLGSIYLSAYLFSWGWENED